MGTPNTQSSDEWEDRKMFANFVKALFRPAASVFMPAVAANATSARINRYSTNPWPASSLCRRFREFRIRVFMLFSPKSCVCFKFPAPWGSRWAHRTASLEACGRPNDSRCDVAVGGRRRLLKRLFVGVHRTRPDTNTPKLAAIFVE